MRQRFRQRILPASLALAAAVGAADFADAALRGAARYLDRALRGSVALRVPYLAAASGGCGTSRRASGVSACRAISLLAFDGATREYLAIDSIR
jgi:hypothetical protein